MLDSAAADLVDSIARLCVLRTEDYTLINTVYKRERNSHAQAAPSGTTNTPHLTTSTSLTSAGTSSAATYLRYLTAEVDGREAQRCAAEERWCTSVREWAARFLQEVGMSPDKSSANAVSAKNGEVLSFRMELQPPVCTFWEPLRRDGRQIDSFQQAYAGVVRQAYELRRSDLTNTPFAQSFGSSCLYIGAALSPPPSAPQATPCTGEEDDVLQSFLSTFATDVAHVHALFFPSAPSDASANTASSPTLLLQEMHPLHEGGTLTEMNRSRLAASRHVWLVLVFLWCHSVAVAHSRTSQREIGTKKSNAIRAWLLETLLVEPAVMFLRSQRQQLLTLLSKVQSMCAANGF